MAIKKTLVFFLTSVCLVAIMCAPLGWAQTQNAYQARLDKFLVETRCLVCGGESLATSAAPFANNLRAVISAQFLAGKPDKEIKEYLRARYGDAIFFRPPLRPSTIFLWLSPILFFILGALLVRGLVGQGNRPRR